MENNDDHLVPNVGNVIKAVHHFQITVHPVTEDYRINLGYAIDDGSKVVLVDSFRLDLVIIHMQEN